MHCLCLMAICNSALQGTLAQQQWWQHGFVNRSMLPPHAEEQLTKGSLQLSPPRSHLLIHNPWTQIHAISPCHLRNSNKTVFSKDRNIFNSYLNTFFRLTLKVYPHFTYTTHDHAWPIHEAADRPTFVIWLSTFLYIYPWIFGLQGFYEPKGQEWNKYFSPRLTSGDR